MEYQRLFQRVTEEYSSKILNWAIKKTGNRPDGEDLAQEVLAQVFIATLREQKISKLENFVWKVAHFVWCNNLRQLKKEKNNSTINENLPDCLDFVEEVLNKELLYFLSPDQKEKVAEAIQSGLVIKEGDKYSPSFIIVSKEQLTQLQNGYFKPLLEEITPKTEELAKTISQMHYKNFPPVSRGCIDYFTYLDLWYFGIYAFTFAAQDKKLYIPQSPQQGVPLTLVLIK